LIFSNKIIKIEILNTNGTVAVTSERNFVFPKNMNTDDDSILIIKGKNLPEFERNQNMSVVVSTKAGERIRYEGAVSVSMDTQLNIKLFKSHSTQVLEERRRYFKIKVSEKGRALFFIRGEETVRFDEPVPIEIRDINIGGVFLTCGGETVFDDDDAICVEIDLFADYKLNAMAHVLRVQRDEDGNITGYGCEFTGLTASQEDYIGKYIYKTQSVQRQKNIAKDDDE
jgi:c-di-GMP-binding flagellar brake protein YcgR